MKAAIPTALLAMGLILSSAPLRAQGAASPEGAYRQYIDALYRADPDQALSVIAGPPRQLEFIRAFIACVAASNTFRQKYIAAYGPEEWKKFAQNEPAANVRAFHLPGKIPLTTYRVLLKQKPVAEGRDYIVPQANGAIRLIRQNGKWYLESGSLGFEGQTSQYEVLAAVLLEYQTRIGVPEETSAGLRQDLKRALHRTGQW
jgi:hypothetical protein